jgi:hypothetical protein
VKRTSVRELRWLCIVSVLAVTTAPALAAETAPSPGQRTEFEPAISLLWWHTDNVDVVADDVPADSAADSYTTLGVALPLTRNQRWGSIGLSYVGSYTRYDKSSVYDNIAHTAFASVTKNLGSRGGRLTAETFYALTQDQGIPDRIGDDDQFLTVRTERTFYGGGLRYEKTGRRSEITSWLRSSRSVFDPIEDTSLPVIPGVVQLLPENRTLVSGAFEYRYSFSRRFSLGPRYDVGYADLERNANDTYHTFSAAFGYEVSEHFSFDGAVGATFHSTAADLERGLPGQDETRLAWILTLRIDPPLAAVQKGKIKLGLDVGISPSGGGALEGTSTNSYGRVYVGSGAYSSRWDWDVGIRYTRRDSFLESVSTFESAGLEGSLQYGLGPLFSARVGAGWGRQLDADAGVTNASFSSASAGVVLYPRGRARGRS